PALSRPVCGLWGFNSQVATRRMWFGTKSYWSIVLSATALKTLPHPLKHPLNLLKALNLLKRRRKKLKKITLAMRALRLLRALRGKIRGVGGNINQQKKTSGGRMSYERRAEPARSMSRARCNLRPWT